MELNKIATKEHVADTDTHQVFQQPIIKCKSKAVVKVKQPNTFELLTEFSHASVILSFYGYYERGMLLYKKLCRKSNIMWRKHKSEFSQVFVRQEYESRMPFEETDIKYLLDHDRYMFLKLKIKLEDQSSELKFQMFKEIVKEPEKLMIQSARYYGRKAYLNKSDYFMSKLQNATMAEIPPPEVNNDSTKKRYRKRNDKNNDSGDRGGYICIDKGTHDYQESEESDQPESYQESESKSKQEYEESKSNQDYEKYQKSKESEKPQSCGISEEDPGYQDSEDESP